jgi:hypothetical protein
MQMTNDFTVGAEPEVVYRTLLEGQVKSLSETH